METIYSDWVRSRCVSLPPRYGELHHTGLQGRQEFIDLGFEIFDVVAQERFAPGGSAKPVVA
jgi:hypothetical protein